jgi:hypothetical protein
MSSSSCEAPRCRHIKLNGTQCGSPALRDLKFCFYHVRSRPKLVEFYSEGKYVTGDLLLPAFEDAHSIQDVIRQVIQLLLLKKIDQKTASLMFYALQIASSNLKRMDLEKPQPEQVLVDTVAQEWWEPHIAPMQEAMPEKEPEKEKEEKNQEAEAKAQNGKAHNDNARKEDEEELPPGTIQACHRREYDEVKTGTARRQEGNSRRKVSNGEKQETTLSGEEKHDRSRALPKPRYIN